MLVFALFAILLAIGIPIGISTGMSAAVFIHYVNGLPLEVVVQKMFDGIDSFSLMAIPFFIFAGDLMLAGGVSRRLIDVANKLVGWISGGLAMAGVLASMFFSALSGSSPATVAAIGSIMIPSMEKAKYPKDFSVGLICSAGSLGIIIPPSITLLVYGVVTEQSIGKLFIAGIVPGLFIGFTLMLFGYIAARRLNLPKEAKPTAKDILLVTKDAIWGLAMPIIVLGGIYLGYFTPTEASAVAIVYSLLISLFVYRELGFKDVPQIAKKSVLTSTVIMFIISNANVLSWFLTYEKLPNMIATQIVAVANNPIALLLAINVLLLLVGMVMDSSAAVLILAPLFLPVLMEFGVDPIHFGVVMIVNLAIGMLTPPFGLNLYVASGISNMSISQTTKASLPFIAVLILALLVITYVPQLTLFLANTIYH